MIKVLIVGYGELASALLLGTMESGHQVVGFYGWDYTKKSKTNFLKRYLFPDVALELAKINKIPLVKTASINDYKFIEKVKKTGADVVLIGSWGEILKSNIISELTCINCHPSLLPFHRGSNPYFSAISNGETKSGITFHYIDEGIDSGDIILQAEVDITKSDTGGSLRDKCAYLTRKNVKALLDGIEKGTITTFPQDESSSTYYSKVSEDDIKIDWAQPAEVIHNRIRSLNPWTKCYTSYRNEFLMIGSSQIIELDYEESVSGKILEKYKNNILVSTKDKNKAVLISDLHFFGFFNFFYSSFLIKHFIKKGDFFNEK